MAAAAEFHSRMSSRLPSTMAGVAVTWSSIDHMAFFDAFSLVNLIGQRPLLMIVGNRAVTAWMSIHAFQNAIGPKELHWIDGASHNDLYYKKQYVDPPP